MTGEWIQNKAEVVDYLAKMKGWWLEGNFRSKPSPTGRPTYKFHNFIQIMVILLSRIYERKDASTFPDKWVPIIHQVNISESVLNWGEIISSNLESHLKKVRSEHKFYIASYLMDVMFSSREYLSLGWKWNSSLPSIHVYWKMI